MSQSLVSATAAPTRSADTSPAGGELGQYLSFVLGDAHYALPILHVQEIRRCEAVTRLPDSSPALRGVINLRGAILPVLALRDLLRLPRADGAAEGVMIVVIVGERLAGLLVDGVSDVFLLPTAALRPVPAMLPGSRHGVAAIASVDDRMVLLLDLAELLGPRPSRALAHAA